MLRYDKIWINAQLTQVDEKGELFTEEEMFLAIKNKKIEKIGKMDNVDELNADEIIDIENKLISASLIDCHTHLIYGGNRANEFEQRLNGVSYSQIAENGGGIASSIKSTREQSFDDIYKSSAKRLESLIKEGVTTIEIKTGYGLDIQSETKMLKIAEKLEKNYPIHIEKTFLGAHAVPPEFKKDADAYINYICDTMLDEIHKLGLATCVDAYTEHLAFNLEQTQKVFSKAKELGLNVKLHSEQFSQMGATKLACSFDALSVDHLEYCDEESVLAMKKSNTVAVLLPGAYYFLRETKLPPMDLFRKHQVPIAIATDLNPGTSALCSLQLMMNMSSVIFGLTVSEAYLSVTKHAAQALGLQNSKGSLDVGFDADFCVWDINHPRDLICSYMPNSLFYSVYAGEKVNV